LCDNLAHRAAIRQIAALLRKRVRDRDIAGDGFVEGLVGLDQLCNKGGVDRRMARPRVTG
jgi:hypothetical protein